MIQVSIPQLCELVNGKLDHRRDNVYGICPKCGHDEFGISVRNGHIFGCFRKSKCGWTGNIYTLLIHLGRLHEFIESDGYQTYEGKLKNKFEDVEVQLNLPNSTLPVAYSRVFFNEYLLGRGFNDSDFLRYEVGTSRVDSEVGFGKYVIFPVYIGKEVKGWVGRHIWEKRVIESWNERHPSQKILRYKNSKGTDFSKLLYGYNELHDKVHTIILVEGVFDKKNVDKILSLGQSSGVKCLSTFKCGCSIEQIYQIKQFTSIVNIIVMYDNDVINNIRKTALQLESYFDNVFIGFNEINNSDTGDLTESEFTEVFNSLKRPFNFSTEKIQKKLLQ